MTVRPFVSFPDPLLRRRAAPVLHFDEELQALAADLADTLRAVSAIGLAGPHLGILQRVVVVRMSAEEAVRTFVNPEVVWTSDDTAVHEEGSVSMPGIRERLTRPARVQIAFQDLRGIRSEEEAGGFLAAVLQHEIDQLDGVFWIDRLSRLKRDRLVKRFGKMLRIGAPGG